MKTIADIAKALNISKQAVWERIKWRQIKPHYKAPNSALVLFTDEQAKEIIRPIKRRQNETVHNN